MAKRVGKYKLTKRDSAISLADGGVIDGDLTVNGNQTVSSNSATTSRTIFGFDDQFNNGIHTPYFGLHPQWNCNFGAELAGQDPATSATNVLTSGVTALNLSNSLKHVAGLSAVPTATHAATVFGGTGVLGVDVAIGTTGSPGQTPTVTQRISRLTGDISGTVVMSAGADMASANDETLILFNNNTFDSTGVLKLTLNAANELDAESCEVWCSADGTDVLTRQSAATDLDQIIILTDTGDSTILAGSYVYLHADNNTDVMQLKAVIKTSGGTVAVTYGN